MYKYIYIYTIYTNINIYVIANNVGNVHKSFVIDSYIIRIFKNVKAEFNGERILFLETYVWRLVSRKCPAMFFTARIHVHDQSLALFQRIQFSDYPLFISACKHNREHMQQFLVAAFWNFFIYL